MQNGDYLTLAQDVLALAKARGADEAEVRVSAGSNVQVTVRRGDVEKIIHNGTKRLSVRVFLGKRSGAASTSDVRRAALEHCVADAIDLAGTGGGAGEGGRAARADSAPAPPRGRGLTGLADRPRRIGARTPRAARGQGSHIARHDDLGMAVEQLAAHIDVVGVEQRRCSATEEHAGRL